ncbi:MAG: FliA/WhiG family RNA polymerase sigma factor [Sedimentisphaerales bacterium]|nr:FliA/WhiG family RNA polymerase sigma factor [Sedimentisphaerales bacterium]
MALVNLERKKIESRRTAPGGSRSTMVASGSQAVLEEGPSVDKTSSMAPMATVAARAYGQHVRQARADQLVLEYLPLVHKIVAQVVSYLHPPLSKDDLISAGTIGLVKAARDYDPSREAEFKTYAYIRIRGAVIDELRSWSFAPSSLKKQFDQAQEIQQDMIERTGYVPTDEELADQMDMSLDQLYRMFEHARARHFLSIHGVGDESPALGELLAADTDRPGQCLEQQELLEKLAEAIQGLPKRQRQIILLYYTRELTMKQIAEVLGVTESRVSQLHAAALFKLSSKLRHWDQGRG